MALKKLIKTEKKENYIYKINVARMKKTNQISYENTTQSENGKKAF